MSQMVQKRLDNMESCYDSEEFTRMHVNARVLNAGKTEAP